MSFCSAFLALSNSHGSVIYNVHGQKCLWDGSHLNKNATDRLYFTIELNLSHFPNGKVLSDKTSTTKTDEFSRHPANYHQRSEILFGRNVQKNSYELMSGNLTKDDLSATPGNCF